MLSQLPLNRLWRRSLRSIISRRSLYILTVICAACIVAMPDAEATVRQKTKYKYYTVKGKESLDMVVHMHRYGPVNNFRHAYATILMKARYTGDVTQKKTACALTKFTIHMDFTITLPKLKDSKRASKRARRLFNSFQRHVRKHEHTHRAIQIGCARKALRAARSMKRMRYCSRFKRQLDVVVNKEFDKCTAKHDVFDKKEARRLKTVPLIKQALLEAKTKKTRSGTKVARTILRGWTLDR